MQFSVSQTLKTVDALFLPLHKEETLSKKLKTLLGTDLSKTVEARLKNKDFDGDEGEMLTLFPETKLCKRIVLLGLGEKDKKVENHNTALGGKIAGTAKSTKAEKIAIIVDDSDFTELAYGFVLGSYEFTKYKSNNKTKKPTEVTDVYFITSHSPAHQEFIKKLIAFKNASKLTRDLINTSANEQDPEDIVKEAKQVAKKSGLKITVLDDKQLKKIGCGAISGVGQGAKVGPRMIFLEYHNKTKNREPSVAFIGKGITFDSGGMNLKPAGHIETMKMDMAGAGTVMGLMQAIAELKLNGYFLGVLACAENAISDKALHSGDVVKAYNGKTIEVNNTDAEGRLVLADALAYTEKHYKPKNMVDVATLTGAVIHAIGHHITGVLGTDEKLMADLLASAKIAHERFWRLPLDMDFIKATKGDYTDLKNSTDGVRAGTIMGAAFLENFVEKTPWAHIDFAGTAWAEKPTSVTKYGATGASLRTMLELAIKYQD